MTKMPGMDEDDLVPDALQKVVFLMNQQQIDEHWHNIQILMESCPGYYDFYTPDWTYEQAKRGGIQLWALSDGCIRGIVVSQIVVFPAQKVFEILGAAGIGLLHFFDEMASTFDYIAAEAGCTTMVARVRPGIERLLCKKHAMKYGALVQRQIKPNRRH